ncbi:hypothetical protein [Pseudomonas syringae]|uniref:hypothetical protein n=2 Tax=Pseudomonas syringae TaxID=317 RepID=UPI001F385069|nr:hypothetical protein [Pseudomonas syringae]MCF5371914.1 hypothetical protein [Pseudomonas syringae]MCF5451924.1 hypothetical protein [Pseudomonas syringae]MCF5460271.1 hypothetical protein [Pseudomonas syringae]
MWLTIYYRKGCIKSRFLRSVLRVMDWDLREANADEPANAKELVQLKETAGSGKAPITPAITTGEAYSHELLSIIEYLDERSPNSLYPDQPALRLFARTAIHRELRKLKSIWAAYRDNQDPAVLLSHYDDIEFQIIEVSRNYLTLRSTPPDKPSFLEMLYFALVIEVNYLRPIENKVILEWYKTLSTKPIFHDLVAEPSSTFSQVN